MATDNEIQRLAAMGKPIPPGGPLKFLLTLISREPPTKPYPDLAVALAWIATDAQTKTPARLSEAGPWWTATSMTEGAGPGQSRMQCAVHGEHHAGHCVECVAAGGPKPDGFQVPIRSKHRQFQPKETTMTADPAEIQQARVRADGAL